MTRLSCTVVVPHVDTPHLLRCCLTNILHYQHPDVTVEVLVVDQSEAATKAHVKGEWNGRKEGLVEIEVMDAPRIDAGYPIDLAVRRAKHEYFCSLDCDCWPINRAWLALPIEMVLRRGYSFVGVDHNLREAYPQLEGDWRAINNYYRVSRTDLAKQASAAIGFMRPQNRQRAEIPFSVPAPAGWFDNGVVAQWWSRYCLYGGLGHNTGLLPTTRYLARAHSRDDCCAYGLVIAEMVFHLGYGFHPDTVNDAKQQLGQAYLDLHDSFAHQADLVSYAKQIADSAQKYDFLAW